MKSVQSKLLDKVFKRRDLAALMELYEINARLLQRLIPDIERINDEAVSRVRNSPDLYLRVCERCRFTTTLSLTYRFRAADGESVADPNLKIRVYHDAQMAEALVCERPKGLLSHQGERIHVMMQLDCRSDKNQFLKKWLEYLLSQGHCFDGHEDPRPGILPNATGQTTLEPS